MVFHVDDGTCFSPWTESFPTQEPLMRDVITTDLGSQISIRNQSPQCIFVVVARRCSLYASVQHTSR